MEKTGPQERVRLLEERLGYRFVTPALALPALIHKSWANEHKEGLGEDNERLEFLGDAVVDLAASHCLMERFPLAQEGELSKLRALIVNEESLAKVARGILLGELLLLGRGEELTFGRQKSSVLADALEAVLGAVYLDGGMSAALGLVERLFVELLSGVADGRSGFDHKTRLQEQAQLRLKVSPRYRVLAQSGPDHAKIFEIEVVVGEAISARAEGRSKKEAEQAAAGRALALLESPKPPETA